MTLWTAIVPIKPASERKTRLTAALDGPGRVALTEFMLAHVLAVLDQSPSIGEVVVLSSERPTGWSGALRIDQGGGLNTELRSLVRTLPERVLVLHADLPAICSDVVEALLALGNRGTAIAPDRWSRGTNALAGLDPTALEFAFGMDSFARHRALMPDSQVLRHEGTGFDVDEPRDLEEAIRLGLVPPFADLRPAARQA